WMRGLARGSSSQALDSISQGLDALAAFNGLMHENMTRNHGWALLDTGRRIERAYNLAEAMHAAFRAHADPEDEYGALLLILESADSYITYRSRYRLDPMLALVLDLLVLDETNPRSLGFQLAATTEHLAILPDAMEGSSLTGARRQALALQTAVQLCDVDALAKGADHAELNALLRQMKVGLPQLSDAIARQYFNLTAERMHASTMQL
ncbi:MAG: alpha-E domain-containing protein, partial [Pseudomonadota bacterium]